MQKVMTVTKPGSANITAVQLVEPRSRKIKAVPAHKVKLDTEDKQTPVYADARV